MKPASAPKTPEIGPRPLGQSRGALVSLRITGSQAAKIGLLDQWVLARKKIASRQRNQFQAKKGLNSAIHQILAFGEENNLTERQLAKKAGIARGSLHRCRNGLVNARAWLPKLEAALARLKAS